MRNIRARIPHENESHWIKKSKLRTSSSWACSNSHGLKLAVSPTDKWRYTLLWRWGLACPEFACASPNNAKRPARAKRPSAVTTKRCVTEDEWREGLKRHTDCSSLLLCTAFLPARRTELSAFRKALKGHSPIVCRLHVNSVTPPPLNAVQANRAIFRVSQSEEDDEDTDCIPRVQSNGQHI